MAVEFGLLGTIEMRVDSRPADAGHLRQRCVLAALLVDANRVIPADELIDRIWADRAPQRARGTLHGYLSRLRQTLQRTTHDVRIVRQPGGYLLEVDAAAVDLHRFRDLVGQARMADDERAATLMGRALELWRGSRSPPWTPRGSAICAKPLSGNACRPNWTTPTSDYGAGCTANYSPGSPPAPHSTRWTSD